MPKCGDLSVVWTWVDRACLGDDDSTNLPYLERVTLSTVSHLGTEERCASSLAFVHTKAGYILSIRRCCTFLLPLLNAYWCLEFSTQTCWTSFANSLSGPRLLHCKSKRHLVHLIKLASLPNQVSLCAFNRSIFPATTPSFPASIKSHLPFQSSVLSAQSTQILILNDD